MPQITLDLSDATELAETLTFITGWLSGSQEQILAQSLALLGISDGEELFGEPTP